MGEAAEGYIFSQLIPYLGNKRRLLPLIGEAIAMTGLRGGAFADLFAGSTVVSRFAKTLGFRVLANDWEPYSHEIAAATVGLNSPPPFRRLGGMGAAFRQLNDLEPVRGWVAKHLCPADDENPDHGRERMFFTRANGERIDAIRERLSEWESDGSVSAGERACVLSSLIYSASYASNTSGVFKGFHRGWGGATHTALYRIRGRLRVAPPAFFDNGEDNVALREDAQALAGRLAGALGRRPDIAYLDPPYNQHPYGSNYHVLTTISLWDKPELSPTISRGDKAAIRKDWRLDRRSPYNYAGECRQAFRHLVGSADARWVLASYSTDGNMPVGDMLASMSEHGRLRVVSQKYKRYRVSPTRRSKRSHNTEFVAVLDKDGRPNPEETGQFLESLGEQGPAAEIPDGNRASRRVH